MSKLIFCIMGLCILFALFGCTQIPVCGNGLCESGENHENCAIENGGDCPPISLCGNSVCDVNKGENEINCATDCAKKNILAGTYCIFDYNNYPGKEIEAEKFFNYCENKMPLIIQSLNSSIGSRKVFLLFEKGNAPAWTVGDDRLFINADDTPQYPGFILHEGTHFVENYKEKTGNRGWVMEGLADFVRFKLSKTSDEPGWAIGCQGDENYLAGYGCAAAFFQWLEQKCNHPEIQITLNEMMLAGSDTDKILNNICSSNLQSLWAEYKSTNPPQRIYPPEN